MGTTFSNARLHGDGAWDPSLLHSHQIPVSAQRNMLIVTSNMMDRMITCYDKVLNSNPTPYDQSQPQPPYYGLAQPLVVPQASSASTLPTYGTSGTHEFKRESVLTIESKFTALVSTNTNGTKQMEFVRVAHQENSAIKTYNIAAQDFRTNFEPYAWRQHRTPNSYIDQYTNAVPVWHLDQIPLRAFNTP